MNNDITFSIDQQIAIDKFLIFLRHPTIHEMILDGSPGTGKTFLVKHLISLANKNSELSKLLIKNDSKKINIFCTATTNKAAQVLSNFCRLEVSTIHSLLHLRVTNNYTTGAVGIKKTKEYKPIQNSLILIDECSYIDKILLKYIRDALVNCKVLYIGDSYQLTSVYDIYSPVFNSIKYVATLTTPHRFAANSAITGLNTAFRNTIDTNIFSCLKHDNNTVLHVTKQEAKKLIDKDFSSNNKYEPEKIKIVAWTNKQVIMYNDHIRKLRKLPLHFTNGEYVITNKPIFSNMKGIMEPKTEDTVEIFNSIANAHLDIQFEHSNTKIYGRDLYVSKNGKANIINIFHPNSHLQVNQVLTQLAKEARQTKNWHKFFALKEGTADLRAVYACTVYKAQGSTYDKIYVDLDDIGKCNIPNTVARMLLVATTRATKQVILMGNLPNKYTGK